MNEYTLVREILKLTEDWYLDDWRKFRKKYDYWEVKNKLYKEGKFYEFKLFKYRCLLHHIK